MTETTDEMLLRYRLVAENDESIERQAGYWLAIILKDPSTDNVSSLLSWVRKAPDNALQFRSLLTEIKGMAASFGLTFRNLEWLALFAEEAESNPAATSVHSTRPPK